LLLLLLLLQKARNKAGRRRIKAKAGCVRVHGPRSSSAKRGQLFSTSVFACHVVPCDKRWEAARASFLASWARARRPCHGPQTKLRPPATHSRNCIRRISVRRHHILSSSMHFCYFYSSRGFCSLSTASCSPTILSTRSWPGLLPRSASSY